jgi:hypothetical protein
VVVAAGAAVRGAGGCTRPCVQSLSALCCAFCSQALAMELFRTQLAAAPVAGALLAVVLAPCTLCCRLCLPTVQPGSMSMQQRFCLACVGRPCILLVMLALAQCQSAMAWEVSELCMS